VADICALPVDSAFFYMHYMHVFSKDQAFIVPS